MSFPKYISILTICLFLFLGCQKQDAAPKHIFFIVIDSLRADHLGCYGYKPSTSPTIDRLAREGILFKNAYSTASSTLESVISFFNSTTSLTNQIHNLSPEEAKSLSKNSLQKNLQQAGYNTLAVVSNPWLIYHRDYFGNGFTHFEFVFSNSLGYEALYNTTEVVTHTVIDYLDAKFDSKRRNFFYIHFLDPHDPYRPPVDYGFFSGENSQDPLFVHHVSGEEKVKSQLKKDPNYSALPIPEPISQNDLNYLISQYDGEIRHVDFHIEKLLKKLELMNVIDDSLIIVTSDHGEEFLEHGCFKHGFQLYEETIHVPLIFYWKDHLDPQSKGTIVSGIDIAPTILDFCQVKIPSAMLGRNVFKKDNEEPMLFCTHFINQNQRGMRMGRWKLIKNLATDEIKIFDIEHDPYELNNLFNSATNRWEHLFHSYTSLLQKNSVKKDEKPKKKLEIDPKTREQLKALGYL